MKNKLDKYSTEWCEEKKKTCKNCAVTNYYCKRHEPRLISKSSRIWGGMHHQALCPFYLQLVNKEAHAVVRYCVCVQIDFVEDPNFSGHDMKCPDCKGWDISIRK